MKEKAVTVCAIAITAHIAVNMIVAISAGVASCIANAKED